MSTEDKLAGEKKNHKERMMVAAKAYSGNMAYLGLGVGYILGIILFFLVSDNAQLWEAVLWPVWVIVIILTLFLKLLLGLLMALLKVKASGGVLPCNYGILAVPLPSIVLWFVGYYIVGPWLALQKEHLHHVEQIAKIQAEKKTA